VPALPLDAAGKYVAGAYLVFLALVLVYVAIMAIRLATVEREVRELAELLEARDAPAATERAREAVRGEPAVVSGGERSERR